MRLFALLPAATLAICLGVGHFSLATVTSSQGIKPALDRREAAVAAPLSSAVGSAKPQPRRARYEPRRGAYLGVALDLSGVKGPGSRTGEIADLVGQWETASWRRQAILLQFIQFPHEDGSFPKWEADPWGWVAAQEFAQAADACKGAPLFTLEPMKPEVFRDWWEGSPAYDATEAFARAAGAWGKPMFIRFAHEMNGNWYPWAEWIDKNRNMARDPGEETGFTAADYRAAYRNVALMFRKYAPNAALVWCPNSGLLGGGRRDVFKPFYPGDDVVDWAGLDIYERGWSMPTPGAHLWSGQFAQNLTVDAADDPKTKQDESVNFYQTYVEKRRKPLMVCETSATLSYRTDLSLDQRELLSHQWKAGYWNPQEYGWLQAVYGTTKYKETELSRPIDTKFPQLKAILWFQIAKNEYAIPVEKTEGGKKQIIWFDNEWADYRIGGGVEKDKSSRYAALEMDLLRKLTKDGYFVSAIER